MDCSFMPLIVQDMTLIQQIILTDSLLRLPSIADGQARNTILDGLGSDFSSGIERNNTAKYDVLFILRGLGRCDGQFQIFLDMLDKFDRGTIELGSVRQTIQELTLRQELTKLLEDQINDNHKKHKCYWYNCCLNVSREQMRLTDAKIAHLVDQIIENSQVIDSYPLLIFAEGLARQIAPQRLENITTVIEELAKIWQITDQLILSERQKLETLLDHIQERPDITTEKNMNLKSPQVRKLKKALLEFDLLKNLAGRAMVFEELNKNYSLDISSTHNTDADISGLIKACQISISSFGFLYNLINKFSLDRAANVEDFKKVLLGFSLLPSSSVDNSSQHIPGQALLFYSNEFATIKLENKDRLNEQFKIIIRNDSDSEELYYIPRCFPDLSANQLDEFKTISYAWKKIHTLCERLSRDYSEAYFHIANKKFSEGGKCLLALRERFRDFGSDLQSFDEEVFSIKQIEALKVIPKCFDPILEALRASTSPEYREIGRLLVIRIKDLLLEALRLADSIIEIQLRQYSTPSVSRENINHE